MTWKKVTQTNDPGDATHFGGNDINRISDLLNGVANVDSQTINSNFTFGDSRLKFVNGANTATIRSSFVNQTRSLQLPAFFDANDDTLLSNRCSAALENKTIDFSLNNVIGAATGPSGGKTGWLQCSRDTSGGAAQGLLSGIVNYRAPTVGIDDTYGSFWSYGTTTTANVQTGFHHTGTITQRGFAPYIKVKCRIGAPSTNTRLFVGWSNDFDLGADDVPFRPEDGGVMVGWRSTDTTIFVFNNSGTSATTTTASVTNTNLTRGTAVRTYEVAFLNNPNTSVNFSARVTVTSGAGVQEYQNFFDTNIPATAGGTGGLHNLAPICCASDSSTTAKAFDVFYCEVGSRR